MIPAGKWVTEYAVCVVRKHGERTYHNETASHDEAIDHLSDWQRDGWYDAHIVTCQVFRTEWQPLPEGEIKVSRWTHSACQGCFSERHSRQPGIRMIQPRTEQCCYCGTTHSSGLYDRNDPAETPCEGTKGTTHQEDQ